MDPEAARGLVHVFSPKNMKALKAGGRKRTYKGVKKEKIGWPILGVALHFGLQLACLGWQWVVITFAALALAAEDDGSGQEEEGGGNEQEQAEASEDPDHLQGDIRDRKSVV